MKRKIRDVVNVAISRMYVYFFFFHPGSGRFKTESLKENWCRTILKCPRLKPDMKEKYRAIKAQKLSPFKKLETYLARTRLVRPVIQIPKDSKMVVHGNKDWLKLNWPWNVPNQSVRIERRCRIYLQLFSYSRFFLLIWQY